MGFNHVKVSQSTESLAVVSCNKWLRAAPENRQFSHDYGIWSKEKGELGLVVRTLNVQYYGWDTKCFVRQNTTYTVMLILCSLYLFLFSMISLALMRGWRTYDAVSWTPYYSGALRVLGLAWLLHTSLHSCSPGACKSFVFHSTTSRTICCSLQVWFSLSKQTSYNILLVTTKFITCSDGLKVMWFLVHTKCFFGPPFFFGGFLRILCTFFMQCRHW